MGQQFQTGRYQNWQYQNWRTADGEKIWLSMLVETMEKMSRPEFRSLACDRSVRAAVTAQLERPASPYPYGASGFSLRN